jgi:hypothetical protein
MKHKGLSWDGGKKNRTIAAFVLAAVMVLPGVAQARTMPSSKVTTDSTVTTTVTKTVTSPSIRGVSWS